MPTEHATHSAFPLVYHSDDSLKTTSPLSGLFFFSPNRHSINTSSIHIILPTGRRLMENFGKSENGERESQPLRNGPRGCVRFLFVGSLSADWA